MISKIQKIVFQYLSEYLAKYGIPNEFRYDQQIDLLTEFRKSIQLRAFNHDPWDEICKEYNEKYGKYLSSDENLRKGAVLGLFSRSPISKSDQMGNNATWGLRSDKLLPMKTHSDVELRQTMYCTINYDVKLLFDNHDLSDLTELLYTCDLSNQGRTVYIDYNVSDEVDPIKDIPYTIKFSPVSSVGELSHGLNLRQMDFSLSVSGLIFLPYYKDECRIFQTILDFHIFPREQGIDKGRAFKLDEDSKSTRIWTEHWEATKDNPKNPYGDDFEKISWTPSNWGRTDSGEEDEYDS